MAKAQSKKEIAMEVLENLKKNGGTIVIEHDEEGEIIGDSLTDILARQKKPEEVTPDTVTEEPKKSASVEDILADLGLTSMDDSNSVPEIKLPEPETPKAPRTRRQRSTPATPAAPAEDKPKTEDKPKSEDKPKADDKPKEEKAKAPKAPKIPIDAPIPAVEFRGHKIGVFGNILEEMESADKNGYTFAEMKLERFNATAHESFRNKNGRMVLVFPQGGGSYMVAAELPDGTKEPVIEVTNRGRGCLRCRQLATVFHMAYQEKKDEAMIPMAEYAELRDKIIPVTTSQIKVETTA